jgi:hypothetical protein
MTDIIMEYLPSIAGFTYYKHEDGRFGVFGMQSKDCAYELLPICTTCEESFAKFICDMFNNTVGRSPI